jgi:hypothetical protein
MKQKIEINKILDEVICPFVKWEYFSDDRVVLICFALALFSSFNINKIRKIIVKAYVSKHK